MASDWIALGRFGRPHGVRGELRLWPFNPTTELLARGVELAVGPEGRTPDARWVLQSIRQDARGFLVSLEGLHQREAASELTGRIWYGQREAFPPLADDEIYVADLIGMQVITEEGQPVGTLTATIEGGGHDIYVVRDGSVEHLIPAVDAFIADIDPAARRITIRPIEGLLGEA